MLLSYD